MKNWQMVGLMLLATIAIGGIYLFFVFQARKDPGVIAKRQAQAEPKYTQDELAVVKMLYLPSFDDAKQLEGKPLWIKAGY